jgi:hypothetical protein
VKRERGVIVGGRNVAGRRCRGAVRLVILAAPVIAGCGGAERRVPVIAEAGRDSAGIAIVESREPAWASEPGRQGWRLSPAPEVEIGVENGPVEYQFQDVVGVVRLNDGRLVVADGGASEIRLYDPAGRFMRAAGRPGDGPGEYRLIDAIGLGPGDTLWVYDFGQRRFTLLGADLLVARTVALGGALSAVGAVGMPAGGGFVVREYFASAGDGLTEGLRRDPTAVVWLDAAGTVRDTIAVVPGREVVISSERGRAVMSAPVVARTATVAFAGDAVVVGDQDRYELHLVGLNGVLRRIVRWTGVDLALDAGEVSRLIEQRLADLPPRARARRRAELAAMPEPPTRPAYGPVLVDDAGRMWVAEWAPGNEPPAAWAVFQADGRLLGVVPMPPGFRPLWIGGDLVAGVQRDELGVERVRVHRVQRE